MPNIGTVCNMESVPSDPEREMAELPAAVG